MVLVVVGSRSSSYQRGVLDNVMGTDHLDLFGLLDCLHVQQLVIAQLGQLRLFRNRLVNTHLLHIIFVTRLGVEFMVIGALVHFLQGFDAVGADRPFGFFDRTVLVQEEFVDTLQPSFPVLVLVNGTIMALGEVALGDQVPEVLFVVEEVVHQFLLHLF